LKILFTSVECYPAAKVGGLADVVGALPKYLNKKGHDVTVIMPKYDLPWINDQQIKVLSQGSFSILDKKYKYEIQAIDSSVLGFELILVDIPKLFYRQGVYADKASNYFTDEPERYTSFAKVVLDWVIKKSIRPDIIHCHDHHTSLIPFMMTRCQKYESLGNIPTVLTIHNEKYRGRFSWQKEYLIPTYASSHRGLLDWDGMIDPLACGIKCCWQMTTVSPSYMSELLELEGDLKPLFQHEKAKASGLINGIDSDYWNPKTDTMIDTNLSEDTSEFKSKNKKVLCEKFSLDPSLPLISFIGRLAYEKGADLIPEALEQIFSKSKKVNFIILGTGMSSLEESLVELGIKYNKNLSINIMYNEAMAHQIYAGSDFLLMPSRVEPCGLNQMYALRYGTIPVVRSTGGLIDTVTDVKYKNGNGIRFAEADSQSITKSINRVVNLFNNKDRLKKTINHAFQSDFSWDASADNYINLYQELIKR
jgi:starch synthase